MSGLMALWVAGSLSGCALALVGSLLCPRRPDTPPPRAWVEWLRLVLLLSPIADLAWLALFGWW